MDRELRVLALVRAIGYLNLAALAVALLDIKSALQLLAIAPACVSVLVTAAYWLFWSRLFKRVPRNIGRKYVSPYFIGSVLIAAVPAMLALLIFIKSSGSRPPR